MIHCLAYFAASRQVLDEIHQNMSCYTSCGVLFASALFKKTYSLPTLQFALFIFLNIADSETFRITVGMFKAKSQAM